MARITTHALDVVHGCPAAGMRVVLRRAGTGETVTEACLNADGRPDAPLLDDADGGTAEWELEFHVGDYFAGRGISRDFLDVVPVRFRTVADGRYHVPIVCSPWAYQTYRGS